MKYKCIIIGFLIGFFALLGSSDEIYHDGVLQGSGVGTSDYTPSKTNMSIVIDCDAVTNDFTVTNLSDVVDVLMGDVYISDTNDIYSSMTPVSLTFYSSPDRPRTSAIWRASVTLLSLHPADSIAPGDTMIDMGVDVSLYWTNDYVRVIDGTNMEYSGIVDVLDPNVYLEEVTRFSYTTNAFISRVSQF
jgi:hypothetical protein